MGVSSRTWIFLLLVVFAFALSLTWVGCGDDDDDDDDSGTTGDDDDDDGPSQGEPGSLEGCVHDFVTKQGVNGAEVHLLDDSTGGPLTDDCTEGGAPIIATTSDSDGCVTLNIPACYEYSEEGFEGRTVGVRVTRTDYMDTLQYHFEDGLKGEEFLFVSDSTVSLVELALAISFDTNMGHAAGGLYYGNPTDENPIGCQTVDFNPGNGETHYMGQDDLPTLSRDVDNPDSIPSGKGTNPLNGYYISVNETPGVVSASATVGGLPKSVAIPNLPKGAVAIANIYFDPDKDSNVNETDHGNPDYCID